MSFGKRKPRWNVAAAVLLPAGLVAGFVAGATFSAPNSMVGIAIAYRSCGLISGVGVLLAAGALVRRERWPFLSCGALVAHGMVLLATSPVLVRDPTF